MPDLPNADDIVIAVMGVTGAGKSTFINMFAEETVVIGNDLASCTDEIGIYKCSIESCPRFFLVDTPGFDDSFRSDADILRQLSEYLAAAWSRKMQLSGLLYLHRIMDVRFGGAAGRNLRMFRKLCGEDNMASVVLATTFWKTPITASEEQREEQLKTQFWAPLISKGSRVVRQDRDRQSGIEIIESIVNRRHRVVLSIQHELVDQGKTVADTLAGTEVLAEMAALKQKHEKEINLIRTEIKEAIAERDEFWLSELEKAKKVEEEAIARDEKAAASLKQKFGELYNAVEGEFCGAMPMAIQRTFNKDLRNGGPKSPSTPKSPTSEKQPAVSQTSLPQTYVQPGPREDEKCSVM